MAPKKCSNMALINKTWMKDTIGFGTELYIFLIFFSFACHSEVLPQLILQKLCFRHHNSTVCHNLADEKFKVERGMVQEDAANWNMYSFLCIAIPSIFTCALAGYLYDMVLKSRATFIPPITLAIQAVIYAASAKYIGLDMWVLLLGSGINGVFGGIQGGITVAHAYIADITNKDKRRSLRMAIIGSCILCGRAIGSLVTSLTVQKFGYQGVFWISFGANMLNLLYVVLLLPPIQRDEDGQLSEKRKTTISVATFISKCLQKEHAATLLPILAAVFLITMADSGETEVLVLFLRSKVFGLPASEIGVYLTMLYLVRGVGAIIYSWIVLKFWYPTDYAMSMTGIFSFTISHIALSLVHSKKLLYVTSCFSLATPVAMSSIRSIATKTTDEGQNGMILSLIAICNALSFTVASVVVNQVYRLTSESNPGFTFQVLAFFTAGAFCIILCLYIKHKVQRCLSKNKEQFSDDESSSAEESSHFLAKN